VVAAVVVVVGCCWLYLWIEKRKVQSTLGCLDFIWAFGHLLCPRFVFN